MGLLHPSNFLLSQAGNNAIKVTRKSSLSINAEFEEHFINKSVNKLDDN